MMNPYELDKIIQKAMREEEIRNMEEKDKMYNNFMQEDQSQKSSQWKRDEPVVRDEKIPAEVVKKSDNVIDPFTFFENAWKNKNPEKKTETASQS